MRRTFIALGVCAWFALPAACRGQVRDFDEQPFGLEKTGVTELREGEGDLTGGQAVREIKYTAGPDKLWFTADDQVYHFFKAEYDGKGRMTKKICLKPGPDGVAGTADDELQDYQVFGYEGNRATGDTTFTPAGAIKVKSIYSYDRKGRKTGETRVGPDGKTVRLVAYEYADGGKLSRDMEFSSPGADGVWGTRDDVLEKYHGREYAADGRLVRMTECHRDQRGAGSDGKWFTSDDVVSSTREFVYDDRGRVVKVRKCVSAGPDGKWFTGDDVLQYYTLRSYGDGVTAK